MFFIFLQQNRFAPRFQLLLILLLCSLSLTQLQAQRINYFPLSDEANVGCPACKDTVRFLFIQKVFDLSLLLPEWKPVVNFQHSEALEGTVDRWSDKFVGCHVSQVDFSGYHYTHDFGFDVVPDPAYTKLCARRIWTEDEQGNALPKPDTILQRTMHVEWESGLGSGNAGNPCAEANRRGESCGFFSAGHQRGDEIWNWPSIGDWVHVEGLWIWDRGHPPARTELHPMRFCATKRAHPAYIGIAGRQDSVFATRLDIFASGDGGALNNNRSGMPPFVKPTQMGPKRYAFKFAPNQAKPSKDAVLRFQVLERPGDDFPGNWHYAQSGDSVLVEIDWPSGAETAVFARSLFSWWEAPSGKSAKATDVHAYEVVLEHIFFRKRKEFLGHPERVMYAEVAGQYLCLNEFVDAENVLKAGEMNGYKRNWPINLRFLVYLQQGKPFRIHVGGWEADGISKAIGDLIDPASPCNAATKKRFHKHLWPATPFGLKGCLDDDIGEVHDFYLPDTLSQEFVVLSHSKGSKESYEQCPGANTDPNDVFRVRYKIRRLN